MILPRAAIPAFFALSLCACTADHDDADPDPADCTPPADAGFAVGTGQHCYEPLDDGTAVKIVAGPQGGYHIWLSIACDTCAGDTLVTFGVRDTAGNWLVGDAQQGDVQIVQAQTAGLTAYVPDYVPGVGQEDEYVDPASYIGQDLALYASVDNGTERYEDEVAVKVSGIQEMPSSCPDCN